jgi:hypothetical protein
MIDDDRRSGAVDASNNVDQRTAAARLADDRDKSARFDLQVNAFEGGESAGRALIGLHHFAQMDQASVRFWLSPIFLLVCILI